MQRWILLRGLARERAHWGSFAQAFERALPGQHMTAMDLPGNGLRHREPSPASVRGLVASCRAELAAQGLKPPYGVLAMSLGAMVAVEWARVAPGELARCVLVNTSLRPFSPFYERLRPAAYPALLRCAMPWATPQAIEGTVLQITSNRASAHLPVVDDWVAVRRQRPVSTSNALRQLVAAARYTAPASPPAGGTPPSGRFLLLASRQDRLVSSRCSQAIAKAWQVPLRWHPWAGHDLPLDDGQWVIEQVVDWLNATAPAAPA